MSRLYTYKDRYVTFLSLLHNRTRLLTIIEYYVAGDRSRGWRNDLCQSYISGSGLVTISEIRAGIIINNLKLKYLIINRCHNEQST